MKKEKKTISSEKKILIGITLVSVVILFLAFLTRDIGIIGNAVMISGLLTIGSFLILKYKKYRDIKEMELMFPEFLRNLYDSLSSGMSLQNSIRVASRAKYGKLTQYVKKLSHQVSWGVPIEKALRYFQESVNSNRIRLSVEIIIETYKSGGDVASALNSIADSLSMIEESEKERKSILNQYVIILYAISLIFVGISIAIGKFLFPVVQTSLGTGTEGLTDPCGTCVGISCDICSFYRTISSAIFFIDEYSPKAYYVALFFFMVILQSIFAGLVAGQISEGSVSAGIKHSIIMVCLVFAAFSIVVRIGLL